MLPNGPDVAPLEMIQALRAWPVQQPPVVSPLGPGPGRRTVPVSSCGPLIGRAAPAGAREATTVAASARTISFFIRNLPGFVLVEVFEGGPECPPPQGPALPPLECHMRPRAGSGFA